MPSELDYQKLLIDVVKQHGGFAFKSSNRFLIGVADVFFTIRTPQYDIDRFSIPSGFIECKLDPLPVRKSAVTPDTTVKQRQFLNNVIKGGARGAVMSFIRDPKRLGVAIVAPDVLTVNLNRYRIGSYQWRAALVWETLEEWLEQ